MPGKNVLERLGSFFGRKKKKNTEQVVEVVEPAPPARENAVLVIGGTGRVGRQVVKEVGWILVSIEYTCNLTP